MIERCQRCQFQLSISLMSRHDDTVSPHVRAHEDMSSAIRYGNTQIKMFSD